MGEALQTRRLSDAARGRAPRGLAARSYLSRFLADQNGATAVEYGILIGVLGLTLVTIFRDAEVLLYNNLIDAATKMEAATAP
jgi:Flp pilus assembly pilin Flp